MIKKIMKTLGFDEATIDKAMEGELMCSTPSGLVEIRPEVEQKLVELKNRFGEECQFYHVMEYVLPIWGGMHCIDFLMYCPDEWEAFGEAQMLEYTRNGEVRVYAWNLDEDMYSEIGPIGVKMLESGALIRTW